MDAGDFFVTRKSPKYVPFAPVESDVPLMKTMLDHYRALKLIQEEDKKEIVPTQPQEMTWSCPPGGLFHLRGPNYLSQTQTNVVSLKCPSEPAYYEPLSMTVFRSSKILDHVTEQVQALKAKLEEIDKRTYVPGRAPQFLVFVFYFSNWWKTEFTAAVHILKRRIPILDDSSNKQKSPLDHVWERFLSCKTDQERNQIFKFVCRIPYANAAVMSSISMLGIERPVIIGNKLTTKYYFGENFMEVNIDVGSSQIASMICGIVLNNSNIMIVDYGWLLEAQFPEELPERMISSIRWNWCTAESACEYLDDEGFTQCNTTTTTTTNNNNS